MIDNFTDKLSAMLGATGGVIVSVNSQIFGDFLIKLICTVIFAAVGAVVGFAVKRYLDKKFNNNPKN